jgi:ribosomal protein S18 acetylase RimI-like enzyme
MRDNPIHIAALGADPEKRVRGLRGIFTGLFKVMREQTPLCARRDGKIVGVTGIAPPGTCQPGAGQKLRFFPHVLALGPYTAGRVMGWSGTWAKQDLSEPHSHLGPLAVDADLQGQGIGTRILAEYTRLLGAAGKVAYLETDKDINVGLYRRHGFEVIAEQEVLGVRCWFMRREADGSPQTPGGGDPAA